MLGKNFVVLFLFGSPLALAEWVGPYEIENIEIHSSGVYFYRADGYSTATPCGGKNWIKFSGETKLSDRALSVGLTAQASKRPVNYSITGCEGVYLLADRIQLPK